MRLCDILGDTRFTALRTYLESLSLYTSEDLTESMIHTLPLLGDMDELTLAEAKKLLLESTTNNHQIRLTLDMALGDIPRAERFIVFCNTLNVFYVDEITQSILDHMSSLTNIGPQTVASIKQRLQEYSNLRSKATDINNYSVKSFFLHFVKGVKFIEYCEKHNLSTLNDLIGFPFDTVEIPGISTVNLSKIKSTFLSLISNRDIDFKRPAIHPMNANIPIRLFADQRLNQSIESQNLDMTVTAYVNQLDAATYTIYADAIGTFSVSPLKKIEESFKSIDKRALQCMIDKYDGKTLQEIADTLGITRERVRQIIMKHVNRLAKPVSHLLYYLSDGETKTFMVQDIKALSFSNDIVWKIVMHTLQDSDLLPYESLPFTNIVAPQSILVPDYLDQLQRIFKDAIGEGASYESVMEYVMRELETIHMGYLSTTHIEDYLTHNGYHVYGKFILPTNKSYALACVHAIEEVFAYDIKLDSNPFNEDLEYLRKIIERDYPGLSIGSSNRALSARLMDHLVLCGRGRYCPPSRLTISRPLFDEINQYILDYDRGTIYFTELFDVFKKRLANESKVTNRYLLQGIIKYLGYPNFRTERDVIIKDDSEKEQLDDRIVELLLQAGHAMSYSEIIKEIPGLTTPMMTFTVPRNKYILYWGSETLNDIRNINIPKGLTEKCQSIIDQYCDKEGYISTHLLYDCLIKDGILTKQDEISDSRKLYYVMQYFFNNRYDISRYPHILRKDLVNPINSYQIVKHFTMVDNTLFKEQVDNYIRKYHWSKPTYPIVYNEIDKDFLRISEQEYRHLSSISMDKASIKAFDDALQTLADVYSFLPTTLILEEAKLPEIEFEWNHFLVESFIATFSEAFRIIHPQVRSRRSVKSLFGPRSSDENFEDLIVAFLKANGHKSIRESQFIKLLNKNGYLSDKIPSELNTGKNIHREATKYIIST